MPRIRDKYDLTDTDVSDFLALLALRGEMVEPKRKVEVCRDPYDDMVIEAALEGRARYVVTGDQDLLSLEKFETVTFATARTFLEAF